VPVHNTIGNEIGNWQQYQRGFMREIKEGLLYSVNQIEAVKSHAMPHESDIARKQGFCWRAEISCITSRDYTQTQFIQGWSNGCTQVNRQSYELGQGASFEWRMRTRCIPCKMPTHLRYWRPKKNGRESTETTYEFEMSYKFTLTLPPAWTKLRLILKPNTALGNMTEITKVVANSPLATPIPKDVCIVSLKADVIWSVQPRSMQDTLRLE
jgi:hypothetical protein